MQPESPFLLMLEIEVICPMTQCIQSRRHILHKKEPNQMDADVGLKLSKSHVIQLNQKLKPQNHSSQTGLNRKQSKVN